MVIPQLKEHNFLFIGGAARSGTTLLTNLLDSHEQVLTFPAEHSTFDKFFSIQDNLQEYFLNDFISKRSEGQQTIIANKNHLEVYLKKLKMEYLKNYSIDIDSKIFKENYISFLTEKNIMLSDILDSLMYALSKSNDYANDKFLNAKYFLLKQPFYTVLFAKEVFELIPDAKFLHIERDPIARYSSAKRRRLEMARTKGKKLSLINHRNFVEGHTEVDIAINRLGNKNRELIGDNNYKIVKYKELVEKSDLFFKDLFDWLKISSSECYKTPTLLGKSILAGSRLVKTEGIDKDASKREKEYISITTWNERVLHSYYLSLGGFNFNKPPFIKALIAYLLPFKHESFKHYLFKIMLLPRFIFNKRIAESFPNRIKEKKSTVSGNI